jgi:hypothetical protein
MGQFEVGLPLFVFGTLLDRDLLAQVLGRDISDLRFTPAALDGYRRRRARGESFPILVPQPGGRVDGLLIHGLTAADVARLRFFEAGYELSPIQVATPEGRYSVRFFSHSDRLTDSGEPWDLEIWRASDKPVEMTAAARWMAGFQDNRIGAALLPEAA